MSRPTRLDAKSSDGAGLSMAVPVGLIVGDLITLIVVTVIGFASHQTLGTAGMRILATFIPLLLGWAAAAPFLGAYDRSRVDDLRQIWRPLWAMILAAPLAVVLRGFWLQTPVIPVFAAVMAGVSAVAILVWRLVYALITRRIV